MVQLGCHDQRGSPALVTGDRGRRAGSEVSCTTLTRAARYRWYSAVTSYIKVSNVGSHSEINTQWSNHFGVVLLCCLHQAHLAPSLANATVADTTIVKEAAKEWERHRLFAVVVCHPPPPPPLASCLLLFTQQVAYLIGWLVRW